MEWSRGGFLTRCERIEVVRGSRWWHTGWIEDLTWKNKGCSQLRSPRFVPFDTNTPETGVEWSPPPPSTVPAPDQLSF